MITLEIGHCLQGCPMPYLSLSFGTWGRIVRGGCGGPYGRVREVPASALASFVAAARSGLPIATPRLLALIRLEIQDTLADFAATGQITREDVEAFLYQVFGVSPSGKAPGLDPGHRRFESSRPSHRLHGARP